MEPGRIGGSGKGFFNILSGGIKKLGRSIRKIGKPKAKEDQKAQETAKKVMEGTSHAEASAALVGRVEVEVDPFGEIPTEDVPAELTEAFAEVQAERADRQDAAEVPVTPSPLGNIEETYTPPSGSKDEALNHLKNALGTLNNKPFSELSAARKQSRAETGVDSTGIDQFKKIVRTDIKEMKGFSTSNKSYLHYMPSVINSFKKLVQRIQDQIVDRLEKVGRFKKDGKSQQLKKTQRLFKVFIEANNALKEVTADFNANKPMLEEKSKEAVKNKKNLSAEDATKQRMEKFKHNAKYGYNNSVSSFAKAAIQLEEELKIIGDEEIGGDQVERMIGDYTTITKLIEAEQKGVQDKTGIYSTVTQARLDVYGNQLNQVHKAVGKASVDLLARHVIAQSLRSMENK